MWVVIGDSQYVAGCSSCSLSVRRASIVVVSTAYPVGFEGGAHAGDESRAALEADIGPEPLRHDDQPIAQTHQEVDVGDAPDPPRKPSLEPQAPERDDGCLAADRRELASVPIAEGGGSALPIRRALIASAT